MPYKFMLVCTLLLRSTDTGDRIVFSHAVIATNKDDAINEATSLANLAAANSGSLNWEIEESTVLEIDRELIKQAADEILGWEPPPQEITEVQ